MLITACLQNKVRTSQSDVACVKFNIPAQDLLCLDYFKPELSASSVKEVIEAAILRSEYLFSMLFASIFFFVLKKVHTPVYLLFLILLLFCSNSKLYKAILYLALVSLFYNQFAYENGLLIFSSFFPVPGPWSLKALQTTEFPNLSNFVAWGSLWVSVDYSVFLDFLNWLLILVISNTSNSLCGI